MRFRQVVHDIAGIAFQAVRDNRCFVIDCAAGGVQWNVIDCAVGGVQWNVIDCTAGGVKWNVFDCCVDGVKWNVVDYAAGGVTADVSECDIYYIIHAGLLAHFLYTNEYRLAVNSNFPCGLHALMEDVYAIKFEPWFPGASAWRQKRFFNAIFPSYSTAIYLWPWDDFPTNDAFIRYSAISHVFNMVEHRHGRHICCPHYREFYSRAAVGFMHEIIEKAAVVGDRYTYNWLLELRPECRYVPDIHLVAMTRGWEPIQRIAGTFHWPRDIPYELARLLDAPLVTMYLPDDDRVLDIYLRTNRLQNACHSFADIQRVVARARLCGATRDEIIEFTAMIGSSSDEYFSLEERIKWCLLTDRLARPPIGRIERWQHDGFWPKARLTTQATDLDKLAQIDIFRVVAAVEQGDGIVRGNLNCHWTVAQNPKWLFWLAYFRHIPLRHAILFAHVVLCADELLATSARFFAIARQLPMDLQERLCGVWTAISYDYPFTPRVDSLVRNLGFSWTAAYWQDPTFSQL